MGMQQLSSVDVRGFHLRVTRNTAPDHVDFLTQCPHGLVCAD